MTERAKFEIVGDLLCEWTDKCTCGGYCEPYWMHEKGCGLEPVIPLDQLDKLLTPPKVYFPGDTVPAGTHIAARSRIRSEVHVLDALMRDDWIVDTTGPYVEISVPSPEEWQATVDRAHKARLAEATTQPLLSDPGTGEA